MHCSNYPLENDSKQKKVSVDYIDNGKIYFKGETFTETLDLLSRYDTVYGLGGYLPGALTIDSKKASITGYVNRKVDDDFILIGINKESVDTIYWHLTVCDPHNPDTLSVISKGPHFAGRLFLDSIYFDPYFTDSIKTNKELPSGLSLNMKQKTIQGAVDIAMKDTFLVIAYYKEGFEQKEYILDVLDENDLYYISITFTPAAEAEIVFLPKPIIDSNPYGFIKNSEVAFTAVVNDGYGFVRWKGDYSAMSSSTSITLTKNVHMECVLEVNK